MTIDEFKKLKIGDVVYYSKPISSVGIYKISVKNRICDNKLIILTDNSEFDITNCYMLYKDIKVCTLNFLKQRIEILKIWDKENEIRELMEDYSDFIKENVEEFI